MLKEYQERYRRNLLESVVPFWINHSLDRKHGGFFSCLDRDGTIYDTKKYVWPQGRAVWMFSRLYNEVERRPEWLEAARLGMEFIRRYARDPKGRYYFSLSREGKPFFYQRKPYAAVFAMLAMLEYSKTGAGEIYLNEAIDLFWKITEWIRNPALMDRPGFAGRPATSQLADVMVVASMAMELAAVHDDARYRQVMQECLDMAFKHHDPARSILIENVALNGSKLTSSPEGRLFNPGHSVETAWFLLRLLKFHPDKSRERLVLDAIEGTLEFGWDKQYDGLYYFMDIEGRPTLQLESSMKLWWPHIEAIYAVILAYTLTREKRWLNWLERIDRYTFSHFVDYEYGEWFGYCDRQGNLTHTLKGNNYKGFFHVPRCLLMSVQESEERPCTPTSANSST